MLSQMSPTYPPNHASVSLNKNKKMETGFKSAFQTIAPHSLFISHTNVQWVFHSFCANKNRGISPAVKKLREGLL